MGPEDEIYKEQQQQPVMQTQEQQQQPAQQQQPLQQTQEQQRQKIQLSPLKEYNSSMTIGTTTFKQVDDLGGKLEFPIMKYAGNIPLITDLKKPSKAMVLKASEEVGLSTSFHTLRHPKRVKRAKAKFEMQKSLAEKQKRTYKIDEESPEIGLATIRSLPLGNLMFDDEERPADEKLLRHYNNLKKTFAYIDEYAKDLNKEKEKKGLSEYDTRALIRDEAHLRTLVDIRTFYEIQEALMSNKYYALLPREEMLKLSYPILRARLGKLYEVEPEKRNKELIDYYQNLIRLKQLGLSDARSVKKREERYTKHTEDIYIDKRDGEAELQKISDAYHDMLHAFGKKGNFYSEEDRRLRRQKFFEVLGKDIDKFRDKAKGDEVKDMLDAYDMTKREFKEEEGSIDKYIISNMSEDAELLEKRDEVLKGIFISDAQKERMHEVKAFLMRRCWQEKRSNDSFMLNMLKIPPEQQLLAFYLIENKRERSNVPADFYAAIADYQPNLDAIRERLNKHFYNFGKTNWNIVSRAVRTASGLSGEFEEFAETSAFIDKSEKNLSTIKEDTTDISDQGRALIEAISGHASRLAQFYRGSGLADEMPLDLVENGKLREKMFEEYRRIGELSDRLGKLLENNPQIETQLKNYAKEGGSPEYKEAEKKDIARNVLDKGQTVNKYYKIVKAVEDIGGSVIGLFVSAVKNFRGDNVAYNTTKSSLGELQSILGFSEMFYGFFTDKKEDPTLSEGSKFVEKVNSRLSVVKNFKGTASGMLSILTTSKAVNKEANDVQKVSKFFKSVGIITSTGTTTLSAVKLGQAISNANEVKLANKMLKEKTEGRDTTKDEKRLKRYLSHEKRETKRLKTTAAVNFARDALSLATDILNLTGAPGVVGNIAKFINGVAGFLYKNAYDRTKRKSNMKATVDEFLGVDKVVKSIKNNPDVWEMKNKSEKDIRRNARKEALGHLGYISYKDCFKDICRKFAEFLYEKIFLGGAKTISEWVMYNTALRALGMADVPYLDDYGDNPQPTVEMIQAKIMG